MDYSSRQLQPQKHLLGFAMVIAFHVVVVYALVTGLGKKIVDVIKQPIETKVIEEIKKPPPPPEIVVPPPPKLEAPPPPFIPPPEVQISVPVPVQNTISARTDTPPPTTEIRPQAPVAPPAPPAPPVPAVQSAGVFCPDYKKTMIDAGVPREAQRANIEKGEVVVEFTVSATGEIKDPVVVKTTNRLFNRGSIETVGQFVCKGTGKDSRAAVTFVYSLQ